MLPNPQEPVSRFEESVEAIVNGDAAALQRLLRGDPALVRARSNREHRAMLLHYVAANGVEDERQKTPSNAVEIARILLDAGAEVDAEADMYGGACTTLGLAATSVHPERAGVQNALMQLLIDRGAVIDRPRGVGRNHTFVVGCLANGRGPAAEYLAAQGARLDLEGAAGVGRLDVVRSCFTAEGTLAAGATREQMLAGFGWACAFGRNEVVQFLLDRGVPVDTLVPHDGPTGLHCAALGAHADVVALLIERNAPVNLVEARFNGTPLTWALHGWSETPPGDRKDRFPEVVALLVRAGAGVKPEWISDLADPNPFERMLRADARMQAALGARD